MALFKSERYPELGFYVKGDRRQFNGGSYSTELSEEIAVLSTLSDVTQEKPAEPEKPEAKAEKPKAAPKK